MNKTLLGTNLLTTLLIGLSVYWVLQWMHTGDLLRMEREMTSLRQQQMQLSLQNDSLRQEQLGADAVVDSLTQALEGQQERSDSLQARMAAQEDLVAARTESVSQGLREELTDLQAVQLDQLEASYVERLEIKDVVIAQLQDDVLTRDALIEGLQETNVLLSQRVVVLEQEVENLEKQVTVLSAPPGLLDYGKRLLPWALLVVVIL